MRNKRTLLVAAVVFSSAFAVLFAVSRTVIAQGGGRLQARSQIRTTQETPCDCGVKGDVVFVQDGAHQTLSMKIKNLAQPDLYIHLSTNSFFDGTNSPVVPISPLARTSSGKQWNWSRKLVGTSGAPLEFQVNGIANLSDMSDLRCLVIGNPGTTNIVGGTNFVTCTVTPTNGIDVTVCFTNVLGGATNIFIDAFAWAPIPPLVSNPSAFSFNDKIKLVQPAIPPSPHASGSMRLKYSGTTGQSIMDIEASGLIKGQTYILWVSDAGTNVGSGDFDSSVVGGGTIRFKRDTKLGDPLPVQAVTTAALTDRVFTIRDATGGIHLIGSFP